MEEHPQIRADLWVLYRIDLGQEIDKPDISLLTSCLERLAYEPGSAYRATAAFGDMRWLHWGHTEDLLADLYDALNFQTSATAQNKKAKPGVPHPRPEVQKPEVKVREVSVREIGPALAAFIGR